jgi:glyoxylase-like metal-dependent hydrolase (beta-lactamase superfamily II)
MGDGRHGRGERIPPRTDHELPDIWRLRLPCPWPGVPHGNAWVIRAGTGVILVDTGIGGPGRLRTLDLALSEAGFGIEEVRLVVCTHAHTDHVGLAGPISAAAGCEYWVHPAWTHLEMVARQPLAALEARLEMARRCGVPATALEDYRQASSGQVPPVEGLREPDQALIAGIEVPSDLGVWQVHHTPGHAPSHVVLHQPEHRLLLTGDHLLGRTSLSFDYGHTGDPVGEYLASLTTVESLGVDLCLPGHGRTFRHPGRKIAEGRRVVAEALDRIRAILARDEQTPFEIAGHLSPSGRPVGAGDVQLRTVLAYLDHLAGLGEAEPTGGDDPARWRLT